MVKYRIVKRPYWGFDVQIKRWFGWSSIVGVHSPYFPSFEAALAHVEEDKKHRGKKNEVVWSDE